MSPLSVSVSVSLLILVSKFRDSDPWLYDDFDAPGTEPRDILRPGKILRRNNEDSLSVKKLGAAVSIAKQTVNVLISQTFHTCLKSKSNEWTGSALQTVISIPQKTTVGFAPRFTLNRKFFANLIQTRAFKEMLEKDALLIKRNIVNIMKTCDSLSLNQDVLKVFYDREGDQLKI